MKQQHTSARVLRDTLRSGGQGPAMVVLPMGRFRIGETGVGLPEQMVTISRPIAMG